MDDVREVNGYMVSFVVIILIVILEQMEEFWDMYTVIVHVFVPPPTYFQGKSWYCNVLCDKTKGRFVVIPLCK